MQREELEALAGEVALLIKAAIAPGLERLAVVEAQLEAFRDLRDRVLVVETKAAAPDPAISHLADQLTLVETRTDAAIGAVRTELEQVNKYAARLEGYTSFLQRDAGALSERVAVVETRAPVPGPAGQDGQNGAPGTDGIDGLGFEDLAVDFDGDRRLELRFERAGGRAKSFPIVLPFLRYQGVYQDGKSYDVGDVVTWGGSTWHCKTATSTKPGEGSAAWVLIVKRGRDGRDGVDAPGALPVVKVR